MNKITKSITASLLILSAGSAWATDGTIEFTGEILTNTCEFADGDVINVELGHYAANQFKEVGDHSPAIPVDIPLKNCPTTPWGTLMALRTTRSNYGWKRALAVPWLASTIWSPLPARIPPQPAWVFVSTEPATASKCR